MAEVHFIEIVTRGLMRATLLHVSNLHGGSCVLCSDAAAFLQARKLDEIGAAFLSSPTLQLRLFWQEFSIIPTHIQEKILDIALLSLAADSGRLVWRAELSEYANSASEGAVIGVAASKLAEDDNAAQQHVSSEPTDAPQAEAREQPDIFKFIGIGFALWLGGMFLLGGRRAGFIAEGVFYFLAGCGLLIAAATLLRLMAQIWSAGIRGPADFFAMLQRAAIAQIAVSAAVHRPPANNERAGGERRDGIHFFAISPGGVAAGHTSDVEDTEDPFYVRAAAALGGVVLGILTFRAEESGADKLLAVTELAAEQYLSGVTPDEIAWDMMPVGLDERLNALSRNSGTILAHLDDEVLCELIRRVKEEGGAYRQSFFEAFRSLGDGTR
jgi:hypothetical protein